MGPWWGLSFSCLLKCGKVLVPIQKHRDHDLRLQIMRSAFKYALDNVLRATIFGAEPAELNAYMLRMATQQKLWYALHGTASNHFNGLEFLRHRLRPAAEAQKHLGLVGPHEHKEFTDMWVISFLFVARSMLIAICCKCCWLFGWLFTYFCAVYRTSYQRRKANRHEAPDHEELKTCPLAHNFDLQIHNAIGNLRWLDWSIQPHKDHGRSVNFFAENGKQKFWLKASTLVLGYMSVYTLDIGQGGVSFSSRCFWPGYLVSPKCGRARQADGCLGSSVNLHWCLNIFVQYVCLIMCRQCSCLDTGGVVFREEYLTSPKLAPLVDDNFWTLGFK